MEEGCIVGRYWTQYGEKIYYCCKSQGVYGFITKAKYVKEVKEKIRSNKLSLDDLRQLSTKEILEDISRCLR